MLSKDVQFEKAHSLRQVVPSETTTLRKPVH